MLQIDMSLSQSEVLISGRDVYIEHILNPLFDKQVLTMSCSLVRVLTWRTLWTFIEIVALWRYIKFLPHFSAEAKIPGLLYPVVPTTVPNP